MLDRKRGKKAKDEKDQLVDRLKGINLRLRQKLKEMNLAVERAIEKVDTKKVLGKQRSQVDIGHQVRVRDRELKNAEQQIELYQREVESQRAKLESLQGVEKLLTAEAKLKESKEKIAVLDKEIYFIEKQNKDTGDIIERYADGEGYMNKMKNLIEEIRVWKDRVRGLESHFVREENTVEQQKERMQQVMKENTELGTQVEAK